MPHYENVPFNVPDNWIWTTVEEILELVSGQDFPPEKYNNNVSGIIMFQVFLILLEPAILKMNN